MKQTQRTRKLVETALLVALATVLSVLKVAELPYGGSITLASMLRIPVSMHNVSDEKIYRPHSWAAFGTDDTQAADFAACKHYGPIYG